MNTNSFAYRHPILSRAVVVLAFLAWIGASVYLLFMGGSL